MECIAFLLNGFQVSSFSYDCSWQLRITAKRESSRVPWEPVIRELVYFGGMDKVVPREWH